MGGKSPILAGGTIVFDRDRGSAPRLLLVHRPAYDDWTLPKGKLRTDEYLAACAQRETQEETGVAVRLGLPLGKISYAVGGGDKEAHYWLARPGRSAKRRPDKEVDKVVWLSVKTALARMTYADERLMVDRALGLPDTVPLLVVRHGKAMDRKNWGGRDQARPLNARGRKQSKALVPLLAAYGVGDLASSSSTRCVQTLKPYAKASGEEIENWAALSEEQAEADAKGVHRVMRRLVARAADSGVPLAVCGHRPVLPAMLECLDVPAEPMKPGALLVAHLDPGGRTVAVERHKPRG